MFTEHTVTQQLTHDSHFRGQWGTERKYTLYTQKAHTVTWEKELNSK